MAECDFVYIDEYQLKGTNFYWYKYEAKGLTKEDILNAGLTSDRVKVHRDCIQALVEINKIFGSRGYELFIKEGYRSEALYDIIYQRRVEKFGRVDTDRQLNMKDKPHALGLSVDVAIRSLDTDKEVYLRRVEDGTDALFVDFYKNRTEVDSKIYQELQEWVIATMQDYGFRLGTKKEYFHFNFRPEHQEIIPCNSG